MEFTSTLPGNVKTNAGTVGDKVTEGSIRMACEGVCAAIAQADAAVYEATERPFIAQLATFVAAQSNRLAKLVVDAAAIPANLL